MTASFSLVEKYKKIAAAVLKSAERHHAKVIMISSVAEHEGKSTVAANLALTMQEQGKKVLLVDTDPQASLTVCMGSNQPDELPVSLATVLSKTLEDKPIADGEGILHHSEGVDLMPANI